MRLYIVKEPRHLRPRSGSAPALRATPHLEDERKAARL